MRNIQPPARFSAGTAIVLVLGVIVVEAVMEALFTRGLRAAAAYGRFASPAGWEEIEASLLIATKLLATALVAGWALRRNDETWGHAGRMGFQPGHLAAAFLPIVAGIIVCLSELDNLFRAVLPGALLEQLDFAPDLDALVNISWQGPVLAVVIAPLTEELVFRGLILRGLLGRWRPAAAVTASALLFAATHLNPAQVPVAMLLGLILGWTYVRTRSLGLCVAGHALNNASTYVSDFPFEVSGFNFVPEAAAVVFHPWWFNATGALLLGAGLWWIHRHAPPAAPWRPAVWAASMLSCSTRPVARRSTKP